MGQKFVYRFVAFPEIIKMESKVPFHVKMESMANIGAQPTITTSSNLGTSLLAMNHHHQQHHHQQQHNAHHIHHSSMEPTDLSCKSSSNNNNTNNNLNQIKTEKKRINENDSESICSEGCADSDSTTTSAKKRLKQLRPVPSPISRSPSPSNRSTTSSPASAEGSTSSHGCSPVNLSNGKSSQSISATKFKPKPPPITGIPMSPTRFSHAFAQSLQTPIVTFASPFLGKTTPAMLPTNAFTFWNSLSPLMLSPRYSNGSHFQFPVGHPGANPATPTNFGLSLSPLFANGPFSPFDPQLLFSPSSKSISVLQ